jgi:hypothetical protein
MFTKELTREFVHLESMQLVLKISRKRKSARVRKERLTRRSVRGPRPIIGSSRRRLHTKASRRCCHYSLTAPVSMLARKMEWLLRRGIEKIRFRWALVRSFTRRRVEIIMFLAVLVLVDVEGRARRLVIGHRDCAERSRIGCVTCFANLEGY